ncbi:hypothetical protein [Abyssalbus ytuae]|uniref:IPT/TIG domain-containing protein n=1 Tax=Abyssalbus ytuae TaxID=2926907 RepID=A0A9E6ZM02_9FLAO|nr:hypothetical protein [Abyssalbus ytuae]UOB16745.1 hypothetical protein MQE35_13485 [Abyssalbus ytuae]
MKRFKILIKTLSFLIPVLSFQLFSTSCENEFNDPESFDINTNPPVITSIAEARENTPVEQGVLENIYYIKGKNLGSITSLKYNGYEAGFNPVFVTDNLIISTIPAEAPAVSEINKVRVQTPYGVAEYDFRLLTIESFETGNDGTSDIVTLYGGDFSALEKVIFFSGSEENNNLVETEAEVVDYGAGFITVRVPEGTTQAFIRVNTTLGASTVSESYGFNFPLFVDSINPDWHIDGWNNDGSGVTDEVAIGQYSVKANLVGWGGLNFQVNDDDHNLGAKFDNYSTLVFKAYATEANQQLVLDVNDGEVHWDGENAIEISNPDYGWEPGDWTPVEIKLSDLYPGGTEPTTIWRMYFQIEQGTFYIDDMGFLE